MSVIAVDIALNTNSSGTVLPAYFSSTAPQPES
jgi:hypothetical protein